MTEEKTAETTEISYKKHLRELQRMLEEAAEKLKTEKRSLIVVFEGLDASGKSGCIRRLTRELDTKQYRIIPTAKPTAEEYKYHYLRRFWKNLPKYGDVAIFDRSWYGRVLVERIEGFADEEEWRRAYHEICDFEKQLTDDGAIIVKFWLEVSAEEQLKRFKARLKDPEKSHKITEEDWRNRSKRTEYDNCRDDMFEMTSTLYAPWHIIPADDKKYTRIRVAELILETIETVL